MTNELGYATWQSIVIDRPSASPLLIRTIGPRELERSVVKPTSVAGGKPMITGGSRVIAAVRLGGAE